MSGRELRGEAVQAPAAELELQECRSEFPERGEADVGLLIVDHLHADVVRSGLEMVADARANPVDVADDDRRVDKPLAPGAGDLLV